MGHPFKEFPYLFLLFKFYNEIIKTVIRDTYSLLTDPQLKVWLKCKLIKVSKLLKVQASNRYLILHFYFFRISPAPHSSLRHGLL